MAQVEASPEVPVEPPPKAPVEAPLRDPVEAPIEPQHDRVSTQDEIVPLQDVPHGEVRHLHVLMHAPHTTDIVCKSIASSLVLDYPPPRLLNWGRHLEANSDNLDRFTAFTRYLDSIPAGRDEDLVLIVDPYNTWFQHRPEVLIQRYLDITAKAVERAERQRNTRKDKDSPIVPQSIVFAAQRSCWPWAYDDPACTVVPESTLPRKIYGPDTDKYQGSKRFPQATYRQRYLNSGAFIGSLAAMKTLMLRAKQITISDRNPQDRLDDTWHSSDWSTRNEQIVFQRIFKEQEMARASGNCSQWVESRQKCEFGIHLDYESRLTQARAFDAGDMDWMRHNWLGENRTSPPTPHSSLETRDLLHAQQPLQSLVNVTQPRWSEMLLYTNQYTNISPALIHHDMDGQNLAYLSGPAWHKLWYHSRFWDLLEARSSGRSTKRLASATINGKDIEYWSPPQTSHEQQAAYTEKDGLIPWSDICGGWRDDEV